MNMRDVLNPDECDKVNDFFRFLLEIDSKKARGYRVDVMMAMQEYRRMYGVKTLSTPQMNHLKKTWNRNDREKYREQLEKYKAIPMGIVAQTMGLKDRQVQRLYKVLKIQRPINYKGKRYEGGLPQ